MDQMKKGMLGTLVSLKGNLRAIVWTEPLWGIPYNLYFPYVALYMGALGLSKAEIGYVASINLAVQMLSSIVSGVLVDKLGRRKATFYCDMVAWSIPVLIWAFSQNFYWFAAAAVTSGLVRVAFNSWGLLMVEGNDPELVLRCFSLNSFMSLLVAFVAPLSMPVINKFGLVPTMRALYLAAFVMMTAKFIIMLVATRETEMGVRRMKETKDLSIFKMLWDCRLVFLRVIKQPIMLLTIALTAAHQTVIYINNNFWAILICDRVGVPEGSVVLFTTLKSLIMLACIIVVVPRIRFRRFKNPMLLSWGLLAASQSLLLLAPKNGLGLAMLALSAALEGASLSTLTPLIDSLMFINAEPVERAQIMGLVYATMLIPVTIFPAVAGRLAQNTIIAPILINLVMLMLGAILTVALWREKRKSDPEEYDS